MTLPLDPKEWSASVLQQVFTPDEGPGDHSVIINFYRSLPDLDHLHALEMKATIYQFVQARGEPTGPGEGGPWAVGIQDQAGKVTAGYWINVDNPLTLG